MSLAAAYDVAIIGAGPVGSLCALAHARKGARVALLEANPKASGRLAGEWLHPPAVRILRDIGIGIDALPRSTTAKGFVVFPEDGSAPIELPYPGGSRGRACDHALLVSSLHEAIETQADITFLSRARVHRVDDGRIAFSVNGDEQTITATRIVGADGRASIVRKSLGLSTEPMVCSRMLGVTVKDETLPFEGYGHVVLGGPGPMLIYALADGCVRVIVDIPQDRWSPRDRIGFLSEACAGLLPGSLGPAFVAALQAGQFDAAANQLRPRVSYGTPRRVLIGDAAGHYHPMTAVGMTLGFGDALTLAESEDFRAFTAERFQATRVPEFLAMGLYEVFADYRAEAAALRSAIYRGWRGNAVYRDRTTRILACEDRSPVGMALAFSGTVIRVLTREVPSLLRGVASPVINALAIRLWWLQHGVRQMRRASREGREENGRFRDNLARALLHSMSSQVSGRPKEVEALDAGPALKRAAARLCELQREDGSWEGEMAWCPMLTAQYALLHHIIARPLTPGRRRRVLRSFAHTRLDSGTWSLHDHGAPHLFVTTLVYVAARTLGVAADDPLVAPARTFIQAEGVLGIPSWGKFWLALLNLYDWRGVNAVLPELWSLPRWLALHPSNWYCHTRLIYMAMAAIYARRFQTPVTPLITALQQELFPEGFARVDFAAARNRLRAGDLYAPPSIWLRAGYGAARLFERLHSKRLRARCTEAIAGQIRWELQNSDHTSISPVSGLLNILALWLRDAHDEDCARALTQLDGWIWEDEEQGARVTGARSASWDTGFALQALAALPEASAVRNALTRGADFLRSQQIKTSFEGYRDAYRSDPKGGWCFAGSWHGWPVSDCTAEAVLGLVASEDANSTALNPGLNPGLNQELNQAIAFMLRSQNRDGGFGSYEARRLAFGLEWLNPAEMFGDSMTEHSFVECTASCLAALAACQKTATKITDKIANKTITQAIARGAAWLRRTQEADGSWRGVWGIQFIYGTLFAIRGLVAAGARPSDPALRAACRWLLERQKEDGGWGEHHSGSLTGRYVPHQESQTLQTAWAVTALLEAGDPDWAAIAQGAHLLLNRQDNNADWPKQDMAGVFFRTALLDYALYHNYFPLHALALYERRRQKRQQFTNKTNQPLKTVPNTQKYTTNNKPIRQKTQTGHKQTRKAAKS